MSFGKFIRDPLSHFLGIGLVLLALSFWLKGTTEDTSRIIHISAGDLERINRVWAKTHLRPPTDAELKSLIDNRIKEEILYREALALGLSQDDAVIRRRLAQKMEFLSEELLDRGEPTEEELQTYLENHAEQFQEPARISFEQVYLNPERRGERIEQDAKALLVSLRERDGSVDVRQAGDPILLDARYDHVSKKSISSKFGEEFAETVMSLSQGQWHGPFHSAYGLHLVYIHESQEGRMPDLNAVRDRVRTALLSERRRDSINNFYETVKTRYQVVVDSPQLGKYPGPSQAE